MKKGFRLFGILLSTLLFLAGCTKDAPSRWQELPAGPTNVEKTTATYNGTPITGTVAFNAESPESGVVTLTNIVHNYQELKVPVKLTEGENGSFAFTGTQDNTTKADASITTITVSGTIKVDGTVTMNIATKGPGTAVGTYSGSNLVINYSDTRLYGREIVAKAADGDLSINVAELIPGTSMTSCTLKSQDNGTFTFENSDFGITAKRHGTKLVLDIKSTPADPLSLAKTYSLAPYKIIVEEYKDWDGSIAEVNRVQQGAGWVTINGGEYASSYAPIFRGLAGLMLPQVLQSISVNSDGTITSKIQAKPTIKFESLWALMAPSEAEANALIPTTGWSDSPKGLAFWYQKDGKFYLKLDIANILTKEMGAEQAEGIYTIVKSVLAGDNASIRKMIAGMLKLEGFEISDDTFNMLKGWIINGIPMSVKKDGTKVQLFLDKAAMHSLMSIRTISGTEQSEVVYLFGILSKAGLIPEEAGMAVGLVSGISNDWKDLTAFELGLDLIAK